jgi:hypothetical protein
VLRIDPYRRPPAAKVAVNPLRPEKTMGDAELVPVPKGALRRPIP